MRIAFVVGSYYPNFSAVGRCVKNIAVVAASKHDVSVLCMQADPMQKEREQYCKHTILRIKTPHKLSGSLLGSEKSATSFSQKASRLLIKIGRIMSPVSVDKTWVAAYEKKLEETGPWDLLIPACHPFETCLASANYTKKSSGTELIPLLFDDFSQDAKLFRGTHLKKIKEHNNIAAEKYVIDVSNCVLHTTWGRHFNDGLAEKRSKAVHIEHPLLLRPSQNKTQRRYKNDVVDIVYAGRFSRNYVEPDYVLKLIRCDACENLHIDFYSEGYGVERISKCLASERVSYCGFVSKEELDIRYSGCDILLNIAERNGCQLSSKIFEYISFGKPIIHIYQESNDVNLSYLDKYPLALCIQSNDENLEKNARLLAKWCSAIRGKSMDFESVRELYYDMDPSWVFEIIMRNATKE